MTMARLQKTKSGYRVVHDHTGKALTGTFTGRGAKNRASMEARKIRKRNMR